MSYFNPDFMCVCSFALMIVDCHLCKKSCLAFNLSEISWHPISATIIFLGAQIKCKVAAAQLAQAQAECDARVTELQTQLGATLVTAEFAKSLPTHIARRHHKLFRVKD